MKVIEVFGCNYGVEDAGLLVVSGFRTASDAQDWIDIRQHPAKADEILKRKLGELEN